ncbi:MAG: peptide-binding protein [Verrucomicrobia bacterium]|nr:peptide-binding protein [Verrucomicrobiota bacterium]
MRVARYFIYGLPVFLLLLIAASFLNSAFLSTGKKNEMSIGVLGEPSTLNPIQQADSAASQVFSTIFNGLLKYDENLEIIGDLAKSWELSQTTTVVFKDSASSAAALKMVESWRSEWDGWKLEAVRLEGNFLLLSFTEPGMSASGTIFSRLPVESLQPLVTIRVQVKDNARGILKAFREASPTARIVRDWVESGGAFELTAVPEVKGEVEAWLSGHGGGEVTLGDPVPFLAEPLVVFTLRDRVRWHDGKPFTSRDVAFTYESIMDDAFASPRKPDFDLIQKIETPGLRTVRVTYRKPFSPALTSWMISILPAHLLEGKSPDWWASNFNRAPVGTGPFKFGEWKTNEFIRVVRNPDYFDSPGPWLDAIVFRALPDQLSLRLAFETRQVDFWTAEPWTVSTFEKDPRFDVFSSPSSSYTYIGWNLKRPLFQDLRVRQAMAHAVDIPAMVKYILYGYGLQSTGIFTPQMWFFNQEVTPFTYDPDKARALLDDAGWVPGPDGIRVKDGQRFSFTLMTNNGNEIRRDIATLAQDGFKKIGIEIKVELYEWAVFLKNHVNKGDFDAIVLGWSLGNDYDQFQIWHSSQTNPEQLNVVGYKNPEVDKLLESIRQEYSRDKIISMAGLMQSIIYREQPYLFLYVPQGTTVMWRDSYRICRPDGKGGWIRSPVEMTKAGWSYWSDWFYRPEFKDRLPAAARK